MIKKLFLALIKFYQYFISPFLGANCIYTPTCSQYTKECFEKYSLWTAFLKSSKRILSCHPFSKGGHDPS